MKRVALFGFLTLFCILIVGLSQTAVNPDDFAGKWYSVSDQSVFVFQSGLIYCQKHSVELSENTYISGAYTYSREFVFLFAVGIEGLEKEKELYLIQNREGSFLCEKKDGTGEIYFVRKDK